MNPNDQTKQLTPAELANQLFDAALIQFNDPNKAAQSLIMFLTEAIVYTIASTSSNEEMRAAYLKNVAEIISTAPPLSSGNP